MKVDHVGVVFLTRFNQKKPYQLLCGQTKDNHPLPLDLHSIILPVMEEENQPIVHLIHSADWFFITPVGNYTGDTSISGESIPMKYF